MTRATIIILLLLLGITTYAQNDFTISLQPSMLMNKTSYIPSPSNDKLYIDSKRTAGFVFQLAYRRALPKNFFVSVGGRILLLTSKVAYDIEGSGFNEHSDIYYHNYNSNDTYEYFKGAGIVAQLGYNIITSPKTYITTLIGVHADFSVIPVIMNGVDYNTGNNSVTVYEEDLSNGISSVYYGFDGAIAFNIKINPKLTGFVGISASVDPNQSITGTFISFPSLSTASSGNFKLSKNFASLLIGMQMPIRK